MSVLRRLARASWVPALAGGLVPKCPLCVAAYLSAMGTSAGVASSAAPLLTRASYVAIGVAIAVLAWRLLAFAKRTRTRSTANDPPACCASPG